MRPMIGITLDWQAQGSFSKRPHYALRDSYFQAVWTCGGLPVGVPLLAGTTETYLAQLDGVLVPGGDYPSPGWWYGDAHGDALKQACGLTDHPRAQEDIAIIRAVLAADMPLLGICAGQQTLAVATGGRLVWRVKDGLPGAGDHRGRPAEERAHTIAIDGDSLLARLTGSTGFRTNSVHNEAVLAVGEDCRVVARAEDGVIEAIEVPGRTFALGVQWHPEFFMEENSPDRRIFEGFVAAAAQRALQRGG